MCQNSVYFSAPHFRLVPPHFVCSGDGTALEANSHWRRDRVTCRVRSALGDFEMPA